MISFSLYFLNIKFAFDYQELPFYQEVEPLGAWQETGFICFKYIYRAGILF